MVRVTGLPQPSSPPGPLWAQRLYLFQSGVVAELGSVMSTLYGFPVAWTHPSNTSALLASTGSSHTQESVVPAWTRFSPYTDTVSPPDAMSGPTHCASV